MSSYHNSFSYLGQNSIDNFNLAVAHFDADNGESETGLSTESIYSASADGTKRNLYGTKYSGAEPVRITLIKHNGGEFSVSDNRRILRWLTGAKTDSWLDLKIGDTVQYRMFGHVQNVLQYKLDARIVGIIVVFESASPWAFSDLQTVTQQISGESTISIDNDSDDVHGYTDVKVTFTNTRANGSLSIQNAAIETDKTTIDNLAQNETVVLDTNQMITSDKQNRIFGNDFNFVFPRLVSGINFFTVIGYGEIQFDYYSCIKIGDMAVNINADTDPICDEYGAIQIDVLSWDRIVNKPTTLSGYGISDAYSISSVYNKSEVNNMLEDVANEAKSAASLASNVSTNLTNNYYDKTDIDQKFANQTSIKEMQKTIDEISFDLASNSTLTSKLSSDLTNNYYNKSYIDDSYYNKTKIDEIVANLTYDDDIGSTVMWSQITDKPTTLTEYGVKTEVEELINNSIVEVQVVIDEAQLNAMLNQIFGE